jgi:hypothetical protein
LCATLTRKDTRDGAGVWGSDMFFGKRRKNPQRRQGEAEARPPAAKLANGPDTPVMSAQAMKRALEHASWRDPSAERRRSGDLRAAVRTLERTAACVDQAIERLDETADAIAKGRETSSPVMRGLLATRIEEVLDSLERVVSLAQDGDINLLASDAQGLNLALEHGGFRYALNPVDARRGPKGLDIPALTRAFADEEQTDAVERAVHRAQARMRQFCERLSHDAGMLAGLMRAMQASGAVVGVTEDVLATTPHIDMPAQKPAEATLAAEPAPPVEAPDTRDLFAQVPGDWDGDEGDHGEDRVFAR